MLTFLAEYGFDVHSQNSEDGVTAECLRRIGIKSGHCVEFGGNDGLWLSNTRHLLENGWSGLFIEADPDLSQRCEDNWRHNMNVVSICERITVENVNILVSPQCNVLSIDLDGPDYQIFTALKAKPAIVIIEVDSSILPDRFEFNADGAAGYLPMLQLAITKGYFLLCHTGNLVLIANEYRHLFPEIIGDGVSNSELYFNRSWVGK